MAIQSADLAQSAVSAAGNLELVSERSVALGVAGIVEKVAVAVGDHVNAGDLLLKLDTTDLERQLAQAESDGRIGQDRVGQPARTGHAG